MRNLLLLIALTLLSSSVFGFDFEGQGYPNMTFGEAKLMLPKFLKIVNKNDTEYTKSITTIDYIQVDSSSCNLKLKSTIVTFQKLFFGKFKKNLTQEISSAGNLKNILSIHKISMNGYSATQVVSKLNNATVGYKSYDGKTGVLLSNTVAKAQFISSEFIYTEKEAISLKEVFANLAYYCQNPTKR